MLCYGVLYCICNVILRVSSSKSLFLLQVILALSIMDTSQTTTTEKFTVLSSL